LKELRTETGNTIGLVRGDVLDMNNLARRFPGIRQNYGKCLRLIIYTPVITSMTDAIIMDPPFGINLHDWDTEITVDLIVDWLNLALSVCTNSQVVIFICVDVQLNWKLGAALTTMKGGMEVRQTRMSPTNVYDELINCSNGKPPRSSRLSTRPNPACPVTPSQLIRSMS
jgi:hypothetical protein